MFIRKHDVLSRMQEHEFDRLNDHPKAFERATQTALSEAEHYLAFRFDTDKLFPDVKAWDPNSTYSKGDVVSLEAEEWTSGQEYHTDDLASYNGNVYIATATTTGENPEDDPDFDLVGTNDQIYVSQTDSNTSKPNSNDWEETDPRDSQLVKVIVDLLLYELHTLTQPRNIPEYRMTRRDDAKEWLKEANKGNLTLDFPEASPSDDTDQRMQWGSFPSKGFKW